jgi:hypothetical protein
MKDYAVGGGGYDTINDLVGLTTSTVTNLLLLYFLDNSSNN